ncbi:hybrid sensor histidine kinase/response regulator [Desulfohalovibrio reitneri]|uniref:hybrid sensor histidine kinase/response regulator n=1 Tax=Desulfohalovibrio reitneri TaxID=1307759 RepID=UPI0004A6CB86|nr:hybrid sensor histidine kinase/response regulator [Desulfohalovibrio reitneri]
MARICIIDDDHALRNAMSRSLERFDFEVVTAEEPNEGLAFLRNQGADLVLLDYNLPGMDGLETFGAMQRELDDLCPPVIMITGQGSLHLAVEFLKAGGADFVEKPIVDYEILDIRIRRALDNERLKQLQREETVARRAAEASDRLKDLFIASVAHELRTPLTTVLGYAELSFEAARNNRCADAEMTGQLLESAKDLASVVDDVIQLAEMEGESPLPVSPVDLSAELNLLKEEAQSKLAASDKDGQVEIGWDVPERLPAVLAAPEKLHRVLSQLMDNAVKFTDDGKIDVFVQPDEDHVLVSVHDTGVGIKPEDSERIFHRFEKTDATGNSPGAGVGLYLARRLAERMSAKLWHEPNDNGSTFHLALRTAG